MANESFIQGREVVQQINQAFYDHLNAVKQNIAAINQLGTAYGRLPSDYLRSITQITDAINRQTQAEEGLTQATARANSARANSSQRTQEEITNQRLLARNASLAAQANSTFANSYQRLTAQQAIAASRVQDLIARGRTATQTQRQYNRELEIAQRDFNQLNQRVLAADRAVGRFNRNVGNYPTNAIKGLKDLVGAFGLVGGVTAFAMIAKDIFQTTKELQGLDLALKNVTGTEQAFGETQEFLSRISEAYGIEIKGLTKSYTGFLAASQNAIDLGKITASQIQDIFESVSKASGAMGLSVEQQQGAFLALQQMISKGSVQAEEIRGQLAERLPGAFGILAKSMKVTEEELGKLLKDGKVLAAEVLPAFARELEKAYGVENLDRVESLAASTTRLSNAWTDLIRSFSSGEGILSKFLIGTIEAINGAIKGLELLSGGAVNKAKYQGTIIYNKILKDQIEYYKELGEEEGKLQARASIDVIKERIKQLNDENQALQDNIKANKEVMDIIKPSTFEYLTNQTPDDYIKLDAEVTKFTAKIADNTRALALNKAMLEAAEKAAKITEPTKEKSTELTDKERKALEKLRKERQKAIEEELQNQYRLQKLILESEQRAFEERMNDASLYYEQRQEAANDITLKEIALAELTRKEGLRKAKENTTLQLIVWEEYYKDYESILKDSLGRQKKIEEDAFKEFVDYREKYEGEGLNVISTEDLASEFFKKQADDTEKAAEKLKELQKATDDYLKSFTDLGKFGFESLNKFLQIDENGKSPFQNLIDGADSLGEKFAITFAAIGDVAKDTFAFITQNSQAQFDAEYALLERRKEAALKFAGENRAAQEEIERQYDERQREIRNRELKAQKEQAIFNAIINTAQGVTAALAQANVPLSIIIGALGAAQIAFIASQQVPAYAEGGVTDTDGNILVNDAKGANYKEVVVTPSGKTIKPSGRNRIMNVPKGTRIFKNYQEHENALNNMLANSGIAPASEMLNRTGLVSQASNGISKADLREVMQQTLGSMPVTNHKTVFNEHGFTNYVEKGHSSMEWRNNHLSLQGRTFGRG